MNNKAVIKAALIGIPAEEKRLMAAFGHSLTRTISCRETLLYRGQYFHAGLCPHQ